jgi:DNA-binding GntR family transcriptional regulator
MIRALEDFDPVRFSALNREFHLVFNERAGDTHLCGLISNEVAPARPDPQDDAGVAAVA